MVCSSYLEEVVSTPHFRTNRFVENVVRSLESLASFLKFFVIIRFDGVDKRNLCMDNRKQGVHKQMPPEFDKKI